MKPNAEFLAGLARSAAAIGCSIVSVEPGARVRSRNVLFGIAVKLKHEATGVETTTLIPSHLVLRDRSKYKPHQGHRECERRVRGGFYYAHQAF